MGKELKDNFLIFFGSFLITLIVGSSLLFLFLTKYKPSSDAQSHLAPIPSPTVFLTPSPLTIME